MRVSSLLPWSLLSAWAWTHWVRGSTFHLAGERVLPQLIFGCWRAFPGRYVLIFLLTTCLLWSLNGVALLVSGVIGFGGHTAYKYWVRGLFSDRPVLLCKEQPQHRRDCPRKLRAYICVPRVLSSCAGVWKSIHQSFRVEDRRDCSSCAAIYEPTRVKE